MTDLDFYKMYFYTMYPEFKKENLKRRLGGEKFSN